MISQIINGKEIANQVKQDLKTKIESSTKEPVLAVILVGDNEASKIYVRNKQKAAQEVGIICEVIEFSESIGEQALLSSIDELNSNPEINGIIVQLPLPSHIDSLKVLSRINPLKDVDGFNPVNSGLLSYNDSSALISATPKGILHLLKSSNIELKGKHAVVIGRSNIVGKPMSQLLLNNDCTVTTAHSHTQNLPQIVKMADIVIVACGCPKLVKKEWIKKGAVVIDVGINRLEGKLCGDVDFDEVKNEASFITPVPGGVGPMTVAMLLQNTFEASLRQQTAPSCSHSQHKCCCHS